MKKINNAIKELTKIVIDETISPDANCDHPTGEIMTALTKIMTVLLPAAASTGGVKSNPEYDVRQRFVYLGNMAVNQAFEAIEEDDKFEQLQAMDDIRKMLSGGCGDPDCESCGDK